MAGQIDQLNFEVIIDDKKFTTAVENDLKMARQLNRDLSDILNLKKKLNGDTTQQLVNAEKVRQAQEKTAEAAAKAALAQQKVATETKKTADAQGGVTSKVYQTREALTSTEKVMRTLSQLTGVAFSVVGIRRFLSSLIDITGQFEVQRMALRNMLQDVDAADKIFQDLYRFSSDSTYRFSELAKYAKQLAAFNIDKSNLLETTKMLGDVASGVGVSMDRLILAYGHVKSSGFLRGIQLRSFSQNGVPILEELSKMLTEIEGKAVSLGDVFDKMTRRQIPFEMVEEAFRRMTSEGGKFYQMQEVLAKTLAGQINILKGRWENMLAAVGQSQDGILKGAVGKISNLVADYKKFGRAIAEVITVLGVYRAGVILTTIATEGLTAATNVGLLGALKNVGRWVMSNPWAILAAGVALCTIEIVKASKELDGARIITKALDDVTEDYNKALGAELGELNALYGALKNAHEGTKEYDSAKAALVNRFDPYIQKLREEGVQVDNLTTLYANLVTKIKDANKQRFLEAAQEDILKAYTETSDKVEAEVSRIIKAIGGLSSVEEGAIRHFVHTGEMNDVFKGIEGLNKRDIIIEEGRGRNVFYSDDYRTQLSGLRQDLDYAGAVYADSMVSASERFDANMASASDKAHTTLKDWRRDVQMALYTVDEKFESNLLPKDTEDYFEYLDRVGKHYKEVNEYKDKALEKDKHIYQSELDAIKKVDKALEGNILNDVRYTRTPWNGSDSSDALAKERNSTKAKIAVLEKYKSAYDKLQPFLGDETNKKLATFFGGDAKDYEDLDGQIAKLIVDLRKLGEEGNEAADAIEARLGTDALSKFLKAQTEAEKYQKAVAKLEKDLRKWEKEWGGNYSGFNGDLEKAFLNYKNEDKRIDDEYQDALREAGELYKNDEKALKAYTDELERYYNARKAANDTSGQNAINDLVGKYVKSQTSGMSLQDWGDKSVKQVYDIWTALTAMQGASLAGTLNIDKNLTQQIKEAGFTLEEFSKLSHDEFAKLSKEAKEELQKKLGNVIKEIAGDFKNAASSVREYAEAMGDMDTVTNIDDLMAIGDAISTIASRALKGDWIGAVTAGLSYLVKSFFEARIEAAKLDAALREMREEARRTQYQDTLSAGIGGLFGTNDMKKVSNAISVMDKARESMSKYTSMTFNSSKMGFWERLLSLPTRTISGMSVFYTSRIEDMAKAVGGDLYDAYGNLNAETLQSILDTYEYLDADQKEWIEHAISDSEAYADAMEQLDGVIESIFGDIAANAADKIVDSWWEAGEAALDYADILDDVAKSYAKLLVKQILLDNAFDENTQNRLREAFAGGDATTAMGIVADAMERAEQMLPVAEKTLQAFEPYINRTGAESDSSGSLGSGIKSITENTANLLASYINAIRADVSTMRLLQETGWKNIAAIAENVASPTLNDYLVQCAANSFDMAQSNQAILTEIRSVIGSPGTSGMVVRVERV